MTSNSRAIARKRNAARVDAAVHEPSRLAARSRRRVLRETIERSEINAGELLTQDT
jgi:hypothetical protein